MTVTEVRVGAQRPRLSSLPADITSTDTGDEVVEFARRFGLVLDDWQRWCVRHICAERSDDSWAATQSVLLVPRQCGKSAILEAVEMAALFLWDYEHVIYSAHLGKSATDHMRRIRRYVESTPDLAGQARVLTGKGNEMVERTDTGAVLEFVTRGRKAIRGGSPGLVIFDEAAFLTDDEMQSMLPAMSAQSMSEDTGAQMIYASSAPLEHSTVLHRLRRRGIEERPARMFFAEWSVDADADPADVDNWYAANPGLGIRISEEWIADNELGTLSPEAFAAERLGVPSDPGGGDLPINPDRWADLVDGDSKPITTSERIALDAPPDRRSAVFAIAGKRPDSLLHTSVRHWVRPTQPGDAPLSSRVVEFAKALTDGHQTRLILPPNSPARAWKADLIAGGVPLDEMSPAEYAEACGRIVDAVADGGLRHRGQPELNTAVAGLATRANGDTDTWSRRSSTANIAPFVAATCALARVPEKPQPELATLYSW